MKKITRYGISALLAVLCFTGCLKDDTQSPCGAAQTGGIRLTLAIGDMRDEEIVTRSAVSAQECIITKLSVLLFDKSTGKYKEGEEVDVRTQLSGSDGDKLRTLAVNLTPEEGDKLVVVANYEQNGTLTEGNSTTADINSVYTGSFNSMITPFDDGLPMSGETTYSDSGVTCRLYHSVAKVQVRLADGLTVDGKAVTIDNTSFGICNHLMAHKALVYGQPTGPIALNETVKESDFGQRTPINTIDDTTWQNVALTNRAYPAEYPNATYAKHKEVDISEFDADRVGLLLRIRNLGGDSGDDYYRLDFSRQLRSTGFESAANEYLDIRRNTHYVFWITKIKSRGYRTDEEAKANPGTNIEYTVTVEGNEWESISSNGQYAVKTDRDSCFLIQSISEPADLLKFAVQMPDTDQKPGDDLPESVTTRRVSLVGEDKSTLVSTDQLQLFLADGLTSSNSIDLNSITIPDEGYQLKYKTGSTVPTEQCYVKIQYGNIRHYVPIGFVTFSVTADNNEADYKGGTLPVKVDSYAMFGTHKVELEWSRKYEDVSWDQPWLDFPENGISGTFNATVHPQEGVKSNPHNDALKSARPVNGTYDLSTRGGTMNTANCYIVNAPGTYSLPLVYGNAIKNGSPNESAYTSTATTSGILKKFVNHLDAEITSPYIYENTGCTPKDAVLVWSDEENLVSGIQLIDGGNSLSFSVNPQTIRQGNAVVAVRDADGKIMWSWHIWVTDYVGAMPADKDDPMRDKIVTNYQGVQYTMMPVNIGWCDGDTEVYDGRSVKICFTQVKSKLTKEIILLQAEHTIAPYGNSTYFQWGRKDPFLGAISSGKESYSNDKSWYSNDYTFTKRANYVTIGAAIQQPHYFFGGFTNNYTWSKTSYRNLWSVDNTAYNTGNDNKVIKSIYDPSPAGYCVPASNAFTGFTYTGEKIYTSSIGTQINSPYTSKEDCAANFGFEFYCNKMTGESAYDTTGGTIFFPFSGLRAIASAQNTEGRATKVGFSAGYWTAIPSSGSDRGMDIFVNGDVVNPLSADYRGYGYAVRPVREQN